MDEQQQRRVNEAEMDEQERREVEEAEKLYAEARERYESTVSAARQAGAKRREEAKQRRAPEEAEQRRAASAAAEQFAGVLRDYYQAVADRTVSAQELNAQLTQDFFNRVIENLRTQAEDTRQMGQQLADQQQRATETGRTLTQESVGAYMEFVNSMFTFWQGSAQQAQRQAQR